MTQPGAPAGSYSLSGFENVNLYNGNLNFNLPLVKIGGRGKAQSSINLAIDSSKWEVERDSTDSGNSEGPKVRRLANGTFENFELTEAQQNFCDSEVGINNTPIAFDSCMLNLNNGNVLNYFDLMTTNMNLPPGVYFSSYWVRESTMPRPGYNPGLMYARTGKLWNTYITRLFFTASDGTEYELRDQATEGKPIYHPSGGWVSRGQIFLSADGAGLRFVSSTAINDNTAGQYIDGEHEGKRVSGTLYFPDGTKYEINDGDVSQIKDIDGNKITYTYNVFHKVTGIVDSMGRQVVIGYDNPANDQNDADLIFDTISTQTSSTGWQTIKIYKTKLGKALRSGFNLKTYGEMWGDFTTQQQLPTTIYDPAGVITKVELPDQRAYRLFYTPYNEIARIELPTGGAFEYDFPGPVYQWGTIFRPIIERRVYASGGSANNDHFTSKQKYIRHDPVGTFPDIASKVTVEEYTGSTSTEASHLNSKTDHFFYGLPNMVSHKLYPKWDEGREYKTELFTSNGTLKQRTENEWVNPMTVPWGDTRVGKRTRVKSVTTTIFEEGQSLASKVEYGYDNNSLTNNKTEEWTYDFGVGVPGRPIKHSVTSYLQVNIYHNNFNYNDPSIHLLALPELITIKDVKYDGTETPIAKSEIRYDESASQPLTCSETVTGWENPDAGNPPYPAKTRGNPTSTRVWNPTDDSWILTRAEFDCFGNPIRSWNANGHMSQVGYSSQYLYVYPTSTITPVPSDGVHGSDTPFTTSTTYDFYTGHPLTVTDPNGQQITAYYTDPATGYTDPLLRPVKVTAPNGQQTIFEYGDTVGNLYVKTKKQIDGTNWDEATTFFDGLGRTVKAQAKDSQGDVFVETQYDNMGRVKQVTNPYRNGDQIYWTKTKYDELGRTIETFAPAINPVTAQSTGTIEYSLSTVPGQLGTVVTATDAANRKGRSITNLLGQLIRVDEPSHTGSLDPLPTSMPNPNPSPSPTPDPPPGGGGGCYTESIPNCLENTGSYPMASTYYKYDALGRMVQVTQGVQKRYFLYDGLGRLLRVKQPEQEANQSLAWDDPVTGNSDWSAGFSYDNLGNVLTVTDAKGTVIHNSYDNAGRVKTRTYSGEPAGVNTPQVDYYYDGKGLSQPANFALGELTKVTSSISETRYTNFDQMGQVLSSEQVTDGQTYPSSYKYNLSGGLIEQTYPSGEIVRNFLESDGDLARIAVSGHTSASDFSYTATGKIASLRLGNGLWESGKLNEREQITEIALGTSVNDGSRWKVNYEYGELTAGGTVNTAKNTGNIARQTTNFSGLSAPLVQTYKYDSLDRITEAQEPNGTSTLHWNQTFGYDRYGNRVSFAQNIGGQALAINNLTLPTVDSVTNRFITNQGYSYDKNGNVINDPANNGRSFIFNGDNKQIQVKDTGDPNPVGTYFYDGNGKRVKKVVPGGETTVFVYDAAGKLIAEYSNQAATAPTVSYTATDPLGSPRVITDKQGNIISRRDFMPFGEDLNAGIGNRTTAHKYGSGNNNIRKRFTGYEKDQETGLDFAEARYYNNQHGRFTAVDPLLASGKSADPQTFNRYAYVLNNPLVLTDPTGMQVSSNPNIGDIDENGFTWDGQVWQDPVASVIRICDWCDRAINSLSKWFNNSATQLQTFATTGDPSDQSLKWFGNRGYRSNQVINAINHDIGAGAEMALSFDPTGQHNLVQTSLRFHQGQASATELGVSGVFAGTAPLTLMSGGGFGRNAVKEGAEFTAPSIAGLLKPGKEIGTFSVYYGFDSANTVRYIGATGRDSAVRFIEHFRAIGTGKELLQYRTIEGAMNLTKPQARTLEQIFINQYGLGRNGGTLLNQRNSIAPKWWETFGVPPSQ